MNNQAQDKNTKSSAIETVFDFVEVAVFALVMVAVLFAFFIRIVGVDGGSMMNTLQNHDRLLLVKAFYTPERGDIVVINRENNTPLIKRVIAVGGDTIEINPETNEVILNGEILNEPYVDESYPTLLFDMNGPVTVPEGHVFVMGDHRDASHDSRKNDIGCVDEDAIVGKAIFRFYPLESFGGLYDNLG